MKLSPHPKPFHLSLGERGEMMAWHYLIQQGYKIIEKNYRCPLGEMDVIAQKKGYLCFIEIKTRSGRVLGYPEEAVSLPKQKKLIRIAEWYLKEIRKGDLRVSFDVLAITLNENENPQFRLIENAFSLN
ncbi:MAG: YraN family protein [Candidatus Omnitrophica bacterium]|nr:YraN family protein [Candidatus Omnitrophota bacterium]